MTQVDLISWHKTPSERNFRQIIKVNSVEVCGVLGNIEMFPMFKDFIEASAMSLPGLIHKCPYKGVSEIVSIFF
jgi:hypothetical protein